MSLAIFSWTGTPVGTLQGGFDLGDRMIRTLAGYPDGKNFTIGGGLKHFFLPIHPLLFIVRPLRQG